MNVADQLETVRKKEREGVSARIKNEAGLLQKPMKANGNPIC